ncbi:MAG TPA: M1 family metallopeptidase [Vicinamibacterales bacterium]|nr:M1 family metallopeptidase [Vicinamibacterales bacterium]
MALADTSAQTVSRQAIPAIAPPVLDPAQARRTASYDIDVTLDPATRTLTGKELITWVNPGRIAAYSFRLHLYWNAFRNTNSTWLKQRQLIGDTPFADRPADHFGYSNVTRIARVNADGSETDLTSALQFASPDDQNTDDRSLAAAFLEDPVEPGGVLRLRVEWTGRFPKNFDRTGAIGNYFFVSQWFPKLGAFEAGGWSAHQFFANSEFFADFGHYDVRMTVPSGWIVGATGVEQSRADNGNGTTTHRYTQGDVHDFAWTTSPDFIEKRQTFEAPGRAPVQMRLLIQPEHEYLADRHFAAAAAALKYYGEWYGAYQYPSLTIVDPVFQSDSAGMEYPTIFTAGARWLSPRHSNDPEYVVIHEAGHQFWYGMVANNEVQFAWLDEGINEYSDSRVQSIAFQPNYHVERFFGDFIPWQYRDIALQRATDTNHMNTYRRAPDRDSLSVPTAGLWPATHQNMSYHKAALMLHTLERMYTWDVMQRVLSVFFARFKFKHPTPDDFFGVLNEVTGKDHAWFIEQVYRGSNTFDYAIDRLVSEPIKARGLMESPQGLTFQETSAAGQFRTSVTVRRLAAGQFPVDVLVTFANGEQARQQWDGRGRWAVFTFDRAVEAVSAQIDPERHLLLDTNYTNNSRTTAPAGGAAATKWSLRWMVWLQDLLMNCAFFI